MHVHDVITATPERAPHVLAQCQPDCHPGLRTVEVNGLTSSDPNDVRLGDRALEIRGDDVHVMAEPPGFAREEMHVLADTAQGECTCTMS